MVVALEKARNLPRRETQDMAKQTAGNATASTKGMMPDDLAGSIGNVIKVTKKVGAIGASLGLGPVGTVGVVLVLACLIPALLAPFAPVINVAILCYFAKKILVRTGRFPGMATDGDASGGDGGKQSR